MRQKDVLFILIPSFLLVLFWVIFSIIHSATSSTIIETQSQTIIPITPHFDEKSVAEIKNRGHIDPLYALPQPSQSPSPSGAPAALQLSLTPSPVAPVQATQGGSLQ